jgi:hut operon positive regulator
MKDTGIGKIALNLVLADEETSQIIKGQYENKGYSLVRGQVGTMDVKKIYAAVETAVFREDMIRENYHEEHALYHAISEAISGYFRGYVALDTVLRTTGLEFAVVRGELVVGGSSGGEWIAVVLYGFVGSPRRGFEHEAIGLGIQSI